MVCRFLAALAIVASLCLPADAQFTAYTGSRPAMFQVSAGVKKFFNSFSSYEFVAPFPPFQNPLSRLEFPIDQWFAGGCVSYDTRYWLLKGQAWININKESSMMMQDSDWDDDYLLSQKTIFSESKCRLNRGLLLEIGTVGTFWDILPSYLKPVAGYRYQYFSFTTHDGYQAELGGLSGDLNGDGINFKQWFNHFYAGAMLTSETPRPYLGGTRNSVSIQADYAYVTGGNEDQHLLRVGDRLTREPTRGYCLHLSGTFDFMLGTRAKAAVEVDFKRIETKGSHQLLNPAFNVDFSFDGSRVWSDQLSVAATGEIYY